VQRAVYQPISGTGQLVLTGRVPNSHTDTHYGTAGLNAGLTGYSQAVQSWNAAAPPRCPPSGAAGPCQASIPTPVYVNDMSLVWGGILDYNDTWMLPHTSHRRGTSADIGSTGQSDPAVPYSPFPTNIPVAVRKTALLLLKANGLTVASEAGCPTAMSASCNHWHVNSAQ
jgi:hypothetical protein